tara:strand:+ start:1186 stop:1428 length:243 start_codon:yes stop_codon:yes gene_type:complete
MSFADLDSDSYHKRYQGSSYGGGNAGGAAPRGGAGYGSTWNDDIYSGMPAAGGRSAAPAQTNSARFDELVDRIVKGVMIL